MRNSGHTMGYIEKALKSGIINYERKVTNGNKPKTHHHYKPLHMDSNYMAGAGGRRTSCPRKAGTKTRVRIKKVVEARRGKSSRRLV